MISSPTTSTSASLRTPSPTVTLSALPDFDEPAKPSGSNGGSGNARIWQLENRVQDLKSSLQRALAERREALEETNLLRTQITEEKRKLALISTEFDDARRENDELRTGQQSDRAAFAALQREHEQARLNWMTESIKAQKQSRKAEDYGDEDRPVKRLAVTVVKGKEKEGGELAEDEREELLSVVRRMTHEADYANRTRERLEKKLQSVTARLREEAAEREEIHTRFVAEMAMAKKEKLQMQAEIDQLTTRLKLTLSPPAFDAPPTSTSYHPPVPVYDRAISSSLSPRAPQRDLPSHTIARIR